MLHILVDNLDRAFSLEIEDVVFLKFPYCSSSSQSVGNWDGIRKLGECNGEEKPGIQQTPSEVVERHSGLEEPAEEGDYFCAADEKAGDMENNDCWEPMHFAECFLFVAVSHPPLVVS